MNRKHPKANCEDCTLSGEPYVRSTIPTGARLAVVGEAPGRQEARDGTLFTGAPGKLLWTVLEHNGYKRSNVMLTTACLCRPPENRAPTKSEVACCNDRLIAEIEGSNATQILTLGNTASTAVFGKSTPISTLRAGPPRKSDKFLDREVVPTIHPALCLRNGDSFPSLVNDVAKLNQTTRVRWEPPEYRVFDTEHAALKACDNLLEYKNRLVVDIETAHDKDVAFEHPSHYDLLCVGIGYKPGKVAIIERTALKSSAVRKKLGDLLVRSRITAHNGKFDVQGLRQLDSRINLHFDTMLSSYAMDERGGVHGLGYRGQEVLGTPNWKNAMKRWSNYADAPADVLDQYNAYDVATTWGLEDHDRSVFDDDNRKLMERLLRTSNNYVPVELSGIAVDLEYLEKLEEQYQGTLAEAISNLQLYMPEPGNHKITKNPNSVKQITQTLLDLGVPFVESTDAQHLNDMAKKAKGDCALFLDALLSYRKDQKLYGTYIAGARKRLYNGRLYPTFLLHGTTSGRLSCRNPNLFNIPRGSSIRRMFVPSDGRVFVQADYSQVEWRVVAALSQDKFLHEIFNDPTRDIHSEVAAKLGITRQRAKTIVYGCVPMSTQALTSKGWKSYDEVKVGDLVLGAESEKLVWTPVLEKFKYENAPTIKLSNRHFEAITTPDHRWYGYQRVGSFINYQAKHWQKSGWFTSNEISSEHRISLSFQSETLNELSISETEAAIIAWLHTDGHIKRSTFTGNTSQASGTKVGFFGAIYQKKPLFIEKLKHLLKEIPHKMYSYPDTDRCVEFRINASFLRELWKRAELDSISLEQFVLKLGTAERMAFYQACCDAEGHISSRGRQYITQNNGPVMEAIRTAAFMCGFFPTTTKKTDKCSVLGISLPIVTGQRLVKQPAETQDVWCVKTKLETWVMRQGDQIMLTGNSTYGMEVPHLSALLNVPLNVGAKILQDFFQVIPEVVAWQASIKHKLFTEHDDLVTPYGRHRRFWLITDENKKDVYKEALSFLPQSIASDICQEAMNDLLERGFDCKLSVYDSIMLECKPEEVKEYGEIMREAMMQAGRNFSDFVPFDVDIKTGDNWGVFG